VTLNGITMTQNGNKMTQNGNKMAKNGNKMTQCVVIDGVERDCKPFIYYVV